MRISGPIAKKYRGRESGMSELKTGRSSSAAQPSQRGRNVLLLRGPQNQC